MKKKVEEVYKLKLPSENMDLGDVVNKMDKGEDGTFMGRKLATMRLPTRKIEEIKDPLKRAELMNQNRIKNEAYEISKRSENIADLYKFLALYGMYPRKNGDLENEKRLYDLIEKGELKVKSRKVKEAQTKITPVNHFKILSK